MPSGHWSIPFSCAFVMKRIEQFNPNICSLDVSMTLLMRIKFTGLPYIVDVIDFCKGDSPDHNEKFGKAFFKVRANETEGEIMTEERSGK